MDVNPKLRTVARMQAGFAIAGLIAGSTIVFTSRAPAYWLGYTFTGLFLAFTLYASNQLLAGKAAGVRLSLVVQLLQVVHIQIRGLYWFFLAGPLVEVGGSSALVAVRFALGAVASIFPLDPSTAEMAGTYAGFAEGWLLDPGAQDLRIKLGVNIVALVMAVRLLRALTASTEASLTVTADSTPAA